MKRVVVALVVLLVGTVALAGPANATTIPISVQKRQWEAMADKYYALGSAGYDAQTAAQKNIQAFHVATLAWYSGQRFGWRDARTKQWLQRVYARQNADGGWGLGEPYSSFGHAPNPADTSYGITTAWHVGLMLLDGYDHGAIPRQKLAEAARSLLNTAEVANGQCLAYSNSTLDALEPCVYNVTAAGALFLYEALKRGAVVPGRLAETWRKITRWRDHLHDTYSPELNGWTYGGINNRTLLDDPGHLAPTSSAMYLLPGGQGYHAITEYFFHYPTSISTGGMIPFFCDGADTDYPFQQRYLDGFNDASPAATKVALAVYAPVTLRVQTLCGKRPAGLWAKQAAHHPKPRPIVITPFTSVDAAATYVGTSDESSYKSGNFDGFGDSYDRRQLAAQGATPGGTVTHDGVAFAWPSAAPGERDHVGAYKQYIAIRGTGSELAFLGSVPGAATGTVEVTYTDGTTSLGEISFGPWALLAADDPDIALDTVGNFGRNGFVDNGVHYVVYYDSVPLVPGKTVKDYRLPDTAYKMKIFAAAIKP